eukprot:1471820-Rhodomonas_salina.1
MSGTELAYGTIPCPTLSERTARAVVGHGAGPRRRERSTSPPIALRASYAMSGTDKGVPDRGGGGRCARGLGAD